MFRRDLCWWGRTMTAPRPSLPPLPPRLLLEADYFDGQIDLRAFAAANPELPVLFRTPWW